MEEEAVTTGEVEGVVQGPLRHTVESSDTVEGVTTRVSHDVLGVPNGPGPPSVRSVGRSLPASGLACIRPRPPPDGSSFLKFLSKGPTVRSFKNRLKTEDRKVSPHPPPTPDGRRDISPTFRLSKGFRDCSSPCCVLSPFQLKLQSVLRRP